jgi:hypothetical protein
MVWALAPECSVMTGDGRQPQGVVICHTFLWQETQAYARPEVTDLGLVYGHQHANPRSCRR